MESEIWKTIKTQINYELDPNAIKVLLNESKKKKEGKIREKGVHRWIRRGKQTIESSSKLINLD